MPLINPNTQTTICKRIHLMKANSVHVMPTKEYFTLIQRMLDETGQAYVRVTGMSMWPLLFHLRDGVLLVRPEKIRIGDIVLFDRKNGRYVLHRVIHRKKTGFHMAGDHQWHMEHDLPYEQVMGVVKGVYRKGQYISADKSLMKLYAGAVVLFTVPRIILWRLVRFLFKPLRSAASLIVFQEKGRHR